MLVPVIDRCTKDTTCRPAQFERGLYSVTGLFPAVVKIALSAAMWFLAVAWLDFSGGPQVDPALTVVTSFFIMFLTLLLLAASRVIEIRLAACLRGRCEVTSIGNKKVWCDETQGDPLQLV